MKLPASLTLALTLMCAFHTSASAQAFAASSEVTPVSADDSDDESVAEGEPGSDLDADDSDDTMGDGMDGSIDGGGSNGSGDGGTLGDGDDSGDMEDGDDGSDGGGSGGGGGAPDETTGPVDADDSDDASTGRGGRYIALVGDDSDDLQALDDSNDTVDDGTGILSIWKRGSNSFSGRLTLGGKHHGLKGRFRRGGFQHTIGKGKRQAEVTVRLASDRRSISGTVKARDGRFTSLFRGGRNVGTKSSQVPAGRYTVLLPGDDSGAASRLPKGDGYAVMIVSRRGAVRIAGALADGTKFSAGSLVTNEGHMPVYRALYAKRGFASGLIIFERKPGLSDAAGTLRIYKPRRSGTKLYAAGFFMRQPFAASRYRAQKSGYILRGLSETEGAAPFRFGEGNLPRDLEQRVTLTTTNRARVQAVADGVVSRARFHQRTGVFSGRFQPEGFEKAVPFRGVVFQAQRAGGGFFLGPTESGFVRLAPVAPL